jgi:UDPglucose 6-dehydrogenase
MKIGIIGTGYVGKAIAHGFKSYSIATYDINGQCTHNSIKEVCEYGKVVFVCVPTPMNADGSCDISIVESVIAQINELKTNNIAVIKSTVIPGTTKYLSQKYKNLEIVFSPEFLTEKNYINDFKNSNRVIFGGSSRATRSVEDLFRSLYPDKTYVQTDSVTAEMVKYFANTFLATKVSFANEMNQVCENLGIDYRKVLDMVLLDDRIGKSHFKVPGPDGFAGFGGKCFPKDLNSFKYFINNLGIEPTVLNAVWLKNLQVRENKDWLHIDGVIAKELEDE